MLFLPELYPFSICAFIRSAGLADPSRSTLFRYRFHLASSHHNWFFLLPSLFSVCEMKSEVIRFFSDPVRPLTPTFRIRAQFFFPLPRKPSRDVPRIHSPLKGHLTASSTPGEMFFYFKYSMSFSGCGGSFSPKFLLFTKGLRSLFVSHEPLPSSPLLFW